MRRGDKELKALKRENERLRKELGRLESRLGSDEEDAEEAPIAPKKRKRAEQDAPVERCSDCNEVVERVQLGKFYYAFCSNGHRKKVR